MCVSCRRPLSGGDCAYAHAQGDSIAACGTVVQSADGIAQHSSTSQSQAQLQPLLLDLEALDKQLDLHRPAVDGQGPVETPGGSGCGCRLSDAALKQK